MPDTPYWLKRVKEAFASRYAGKRHDIRLPSGISFDTRDQGVRLTMTAKAIGKGNMQSDAGAFEAWSLALHGYAGAMFVELHWAGAIDGPHAWRFRLRAQQFAKYFGSWFRLCDELVPAFEPGVPYVLNVESKPRAGAVKSFVETLRERELENFIVRDPTTAAKFKDTFGLELLQQQLPVGVFKKAVSWDNAVSPRGSAAIDIWGIQGETLHLFELKRFPGRTGKKPFGIISELFLYASLMRKVQTGQLSFAPGARDAPYNKIVGTTRIDAWLLAPVHHPLIEYGDAPVLDLLNDGFRAAQEPIQFRRAYITKDCSFRKT